MEDNITPENAEIRKADPARYMAEHILAMADDAHFQENPEWPEIVADAQFYIDSLKG